MLTSCYCGVLDGIESAQLAHSQTSSPGFVTCGMETTGLKLHKINDISLELLCLFYLQYENCIRNEDGRGRPGNEDGRKAWE